MDSQELTTSVEDSVLYVTFNRPEQHNAMTWAMYDGLLNACATAEADENIRAMVLQGAGDRAFVAGTDITQFAEFTDGHDGVAYEQRITEVIDHIELMTIPTVAKVRGFCLGGGLVIAAACDIRLATPGSRFGVPVARTLGNCLSMNSYSLLVHHLGPARTLDILLRARLLTGADAHAAGFISELCDDDTIDTSTREVLDQLLSHSPLSMWAAKQAVRRLRLAGLPQGDDLVERVFGSEDFHNGVTAFASKKRAEWTGR